MPFLQDTAAPAVHFGTLEELLAELAWPPGADGAARSGQEGFPPILRVTTQFYHLPTGAGVKYNTVKVIVTALAQRAGDPFPHTSVWVCQVDDYETWQGRIPPGREWTLAHSHALLEAVVGEVRARLTQITGLEVRKGMYCVPAAYHDIPGTTSLFNLPAHRARIKAEMPPLPDELLARAQRVRAQLQVEPQCADTTLLRLFWGEQGGGDADGAGEEVQLVRAYIAFLEERNTVHERTAQES
jgi:hypothetical protein